MAAWVLPGHAPAVARPSLALPWPRRPLGKVRIGLRLGVLGGSALVVIGRTGLDRAAIETAIRAAVKPGAAAAD